MIYLPNLPQKKPRYELSYHSNLRKPVGFKIVLTESIITYQNEAIIDSDNGLSPGRRQAIICSKAGILFIGPLETNVNEMLIEIYYIFLFEKMHVRMSSAKRWSSCLGLNVLKGM